MVIISKYRLEHNEEKEWTAFLVGLGLSATGDGSDDGYVTFNHDLVLFIVLLFIEFIAFSKFWEASELAAADCP